MFFIVEKWSDNENSTGELVIKINDKDKLKQTLLQYIKDAREDCTLSKNQFKEDENYKPSIVSMEIILQQYDLIHINMDKITIGKLILLINNMFQSIQEFQEKLLMSDECYLMHINVVEGTIMDENYD